MAKFRVIVDEPQPDRDAQVKIVFTNDLSAETIKDSFAQIFELEMLTAELVRGQRQSTLTFTSANKEKLAILRQGMMHAFRTGSGLDNICNN